MWCSNQRSGLPNAWTRSLEAWGGGGPTVSTVTGPHNPPASRLPTEICEPRGWNRGEGKSEGSGPILRGQFSRDSELAPEAQAPTLFTPHYCCCCCRISLLGTSDSVAVTCDTSFPPQHLWLLPWLLGLLHCLPTSHPQLPSGS